MANDGAVRLRHNSGVAEIGEATEVRSDRALRHAEIAKDLDRGRWKADFEHGRRHFFADPAFVIALAAELRFGLRASRHSLEWLEAFRLAIADIPEIVEAYRLTGEMDYLLRLVVPNVETYDTIYKQLIARLDFTDVTSFISMEELKFTTAVPLKYA